MGERRGTSLRPRVKWRPVFAGTVFRSVSDRDRDAGVCLGLFVDAVWDVGWQLQAQRRSLPTADDRCGGLLLLKVDEMGLLREREAGDHDDGGARNHLRIHTPKLGKVLAAE